MLEEIWEIMDNVELRTSASGAYEDTEEEGAVVESKECEKTTTKKKKVFESGEEKEENASIDSWETDVWSQDLAKFWSQDLELVELILNGSSLT